MKHITYRFFAVTLLILSAIATANAQKNITPDKPALVIHIVVDHMRADYIPRYWDNFTDGGFKKLVQEGTSFNYTRYPYQFTQEIADYASLSTGSTPAEHGINGYYSYNRKTDQLESPLEDKQSVTIGMQTRLEGFSPKNLLASTLGDELKKSSFGSSKVISVSLNKEAAILLAGHSADAAYWLDEKQGDWVTSNYYSNWLPKWTQELNNNGKPQKYMQEKWDLLYPKSRYVNQQSGAKSYAYDRFPFDFSVIHYNNAGYRILKSTPYGNKLVTDMAIQLIDQEKLGNDAVPDLLYLNYCNVNSMKMISDPFSLRTEDMLMRIDFELEKLITHIEKKIGSERVLFVLTSSQGAADMPQTLKDYNLPNGTLQPTKVTALLNSYLMALYGQGKWVSFYNNKQIYLNHDLIKKSNFPKEAVFNEAAGFLEEFTGIAHAYSALALKNGQAGNGKFVDVQNIYYPPLSGDIFITLEEGWIETINDEYHPGIPCHNNLRVPLIFSGWKVAREKWNTQVSTLDIAPTLSDVLGIAFPNKSNGNILQITRNVR